VDASGDSVDALVLVVGASVRPADVPLLADRLDALLRESGGEVLCDVAAITEPDGATLDALARLQLAAQRLDGRIKLRGAHRRLRGLLVLTGLSEVLPVAE
jgi:anti-anti-sigma regulatory factor